MKKSALPTSLLVLLAAALLALAVPAGRVAAQSQTDVKIRLMSEALRARDAGDLDAAQKALAQLAALSPNDPSVQRLRAELDAQRLAQAAAAARPAAAPAPTTPAATPAPAMIDVKIPEPGQSPTSLGRAPTPEEEAEAIARAESGRLSAAISAAQTSLATARAQSRDGRADDALATLDAALASLPSNPLTQKLLADLKKEKSSALLDKAQAQLKRGDTAGARATLAAQNELAPADTRAATVAQRIARAEAKAAPAPGVDPQFVADRAATAELVAKGRAQYVAGDIDGAQATFRAIEAQEPDNTVAKGFLLRIAQEKTETGALNREKTRAQLLEEVAKGWQRPGIIRNARATPTRPPPPRRSRKNSTTSSSPASASPAPRSARSSPRSAPPPRNSTTAAPRRRASTSSSSTPAIKIPPSPSRSATPP